MNYYPYDSRNPIYRSKIGAVASGEILKLRLLLHKDALCSAAYLVIKNDNNSSYSEVLMQPSGNIDNYEIFECEIKLTEGLYWYHFKYESQHGIFYVKKYVHSLGHISDDGGEWQQTVYSEDFKTPDWLKGGIIYQIFPDRFYNSGKNKVSVPDDRYLVTDMQKTPEYRQNNGICSLGNDYYCGDLAGIEEKLEYIKSLGVNCIYLNPIFEAHSNHRYNTANYLKIDPLLGSQKDLKKLCKSAQKLGIKIILDGVFSHTGDDSIYFNKYKRYNSIGAYNSKNSKYINWFNFKNWPDDYESWWGVKSLPETIETNEAFCEFITGENGVIKHWLDYGIYGWRLDVADELPDEFIEKIRKALKSSLPDAYLLGEVWEDASSKVSYEKRRKFLLGHELDSVMNYPFANAIVEFFENGDAIKFADTISDITENYPAPAVSTLMNHLSTHDTARIITRLSKNYSSNPDREWQSNQKLSQQEYLDAINNVKIATVIQYTLPGVPSVFYGDEVGIEGYGDPFCRAQYPWGNENTDLLEFYRELGEIRNQTNCLKNGEYIPLHSESGCMTYMRRGDTDALITAVNINEYEVWVELPDEFKKSSVTLFGSEPNSDGWVKISPFSNGLYKTKI